MKALLAACRVPDSVPVGTFGLWTIARPVLPPMLHRLVGVPRGTDPVTYTLLGRATPATLHTEHGEIVMEDTLRELRRHLPILLTARGRVLVSGLGLGCVVRGLLAKPEVEHIDVVEIDETILRVVGPEFEENPRVTLHLGDALTIRWLGYRWDFAWHDVWTEDERLDLLHAELLARYRRLAGRQGAWQFNRIVKRRWPDPLVNGRRRQRMVASR